MIIIMIIIILFPWPAGPPGDHEPPLVHDDGRP